MSAEIPTSRSWCAAREVGAKPSDDITALLRSLTHGFQGRRLTDTGAPLKPLHHIARSQNLFGCGSLRGVEMGIFGGVRHGLLGPA